MTNEDFLALIKQPNDVTEQHINGLKELATYYPYFAHVHILLAKAMKDSKSIQTAHYIQRALLYTSNRNELYYYLHPEKKLSSEPIKQMRVPKFSGSYFDLLDATNAEGVESKSSLKNLAQRLMEARNQISSQQSKPTKKVAPKVEEEKEKAKTENNKFVPAQNVRLSTPDYFAINHNERVETKDISENAVKILIKEQKYEDAIDILRKLNLINPKKSVYFADQIRFLEKIIANTKK